MSNKHINFIIKSIIVFLLFFSLYNKTYSNSNFQHALNELKKSFNSNDYLLIIVFVLMMANWSLEIIKWKYLVDKIHFVSWINATRGILFGVTFSLFTPNRIGEFGGRIFALQNDRIKAIVSTLIGSAAQIVVNISLGSMAFLVYLYINTKLELAIILVFIFMVLLLLFLMHLCLYNIDFMANKFYKIPYFQKILKYTDIIKLYTSKDILKIEFFSMLRYFVYVVQFIILIYFFQISIDFPTLLISTMTMFFIQTINPISIALIDFGFRGNVALYVLGAYSSNSIEILAATIFLWFINLIIPAIFGALSAWRFKFIKEE